MESFAPCWDKGQNITEAPASTPVELLGLEGVPDAGEIFNVVTDEKAAKALVEHRREQRKRKEASGTTRVSLENILEKIRLGEVKEVRIVLKAMCRVRSRRFPMPCATCLRRRWGSTCSRPA